MASIPNIYHHRKVTDSNAKACDICYKPTTSVLVTPDSKDFFYVCPTHIRDKGFCIPIIDEPAVAAAIKKEMDEEVARVKREFEQKQKQKVTEKDEVKEETKDKNQDKDSDNIGSNANHNPADKRKLGEATSILPVEARVFALQKVFYQQRIDRKRNVEISRRNRERLQNPNLFPQVPKGMP